jgi:hypothetical protein
MHVLMLVDLVEYKKGSFILIYRFDVKVSAVISRE